MRGTKSFVSEGIFPDAGQSGLVSSPFLLNVWMSYRTPTLRANRRVTRNVSCAKTE